MDDGVGGSISSSAMLQINSTTKGTLITRMTEAQRLAITTPSDGLLVFQTNNVRGFYWFDSVGVNDWVLM